MFTILILPCKNSQQPISRKKFFSWNQGSCHHLPCQVLEYHFYLWAQWHRTFHLDPSASISRKKKKKFFVKIIITTKLITPLKKITWRFCGKNKIKTTRVSSAFRRKKINGARKEIFLNEKKNSYYAWCWIITAPKKHTWWWYILPSIFTTKKNNFTKFLKEIYICFFYYYYYYKKFCFHFLIISFHIIFVPAI